MTISHSQNVFNQPGIPQKKHLCTHICLVSISTGHKRHSKVHQRHSGLTTQKRVTCRFSFRCACEHNLKEIQVSSFCATSTTTDGQVAASLCCELERRPTRRFRAHEHMHPRTNMSHETLTPSPIAHACTSEAAAPT